MIKTITNFFERIIHRDSYLRLSVVSGKRNHNIKSIQAQYEPIITELHKTTSRSKGLIREYIVEMLIVGVDDIDAQVKLFKTIHIISQNIDRTIKVFRRAIATGVLSQSQLRSIGFSLDDNGDFKLMTANQRALFLAGIIDECILIEEID